MSRWIWRRRRLVPLELNFNQAMLHQIVEVGDKRVSLLVEGDDGGMGVRGGKALQNVELLLTI